MARKLGKEAVKAVERLNGIDWVDSKQYKSDYEDEKLKIENKPIETYEGPIVYPHTTIYSKDKDGKEKLVFEGSGYEGMVFGKYEVKEYHPGEWEEHLKKLIQEGKKAKEEYKKEKLEQEKEKFTNK